MALAEVVAGVALVGEEAFVEEAALAGAVGPAGGVVGRHARPAVAEEATTVPRRYLFPFWGAVAVPSARLS